ncbi:MAG: 5'/3'-nucleotidase SurE [Candidatus ainarchaeum sp.]|nr:5'/3'-nucleotidase SurE [Candidatus ainarchaeum sp.]
MNILVTNDDGDNEGLRILLRVAKRFGNSYAVVPNRQRSAVSGALTLHKPIRLQQLDRGVYSINGTPSDCVLFALHSREFPKPDLVLSGINMGDNTGMASVLGSGTLGACWQAVLEDVPAIAFSIRMRRREWHERKKWKYANAVANRAAALIKSLRPDLEGNKFFNINMPENPAKAKIVVTNSFQKERYAAKVTKRIDPDGRAYYWISGGARRIEKGTDTYQVLKKNRITISEISLSVFGVK